MPTFEIIVINDVFESASTQDLPDWEAAKKAALKGALELGIETVVAGKAFFGAEVIVSDGSSHQRMVVSIGSSPLK
jgi:hypothetical protein